MGMEKLAKNKTAPGRYALLDELRGLDLVSMMLYHACWDLVFLFGVEMKWYAATPGHLWQQSICWVFILLSGFCVPLGHHTLRRGATVFGAGVLITAVTLLFMPEERVIFGVLTFLGAAMLLTGILEPLLQKVPPAAGLVVSAVLFALCYSVSSGWVGVGSWKLLLPQGLYANYLTAFFGFYPEGFFSTVLCAAAMDLSVLGGVFRASQHWQSADGTAAPFGLRPAWLDGAAFAGAVSAASAGHLWGALGHLPNFSLKRLDTARQLWYPIGG